MDVLAIATTLLGLAAGAIAFGRPRRIPSGQQTDLSNVDVVVPARNEVESLPTLLASLAETAPRLNSLVVVDDSSTDDTAAAAARFDDVEVLPAATPPPGWIGKSWACATGAANRTGDVLVFVDADVRFAVNGLHDVVAAHRASGAVISVQPHHDVGSFTEHASWLPNVVSFMAIGAGSKHPSALYGPVICCSREQYAQFGGHAAVSSVIAEDVEIGRQLTSLDIPFEVYAGYQTVRFRMYPQGLRQLVEGWTKNLASGSASVRPLRIAAAILWVYALLQAALLAAPMLVDGNLAGGLALWGAATLSLAVMGRALGSFRPVHALLFPLWAAAFTGLMVMSGWKTMVSRRVQWRGRDVPLPKRIGHRLDTR